MNRILIGKDIVTDSSNVLIRANRITILEDGMYEVIYTEDGNYDLTIVVNGKVEILSYGFDLKLSNKIIYQVNGELKVTKFFDNHNVYEVVDANLNKDGSKFIYRFSNICKEEEYYKINVNHLAKNTVSDVINKGVAFENTTLSYIVNSNVSKKAINSILDQNSRIVSMGEANLKIEPNMYIPIDDAIAKHGSVIGTFKNEDIFYLMSKGISYNDSLKLLVKGYLLSNMVEGNMIRKKIIDIIDMYWR